MPSGLSEVLAKASPQRSGDVLSGAAAESAAERVAAQWRLADVPLTRFLEEEVVPADADNVTRLILESHDSEAFANAAHLTVGGLREWLLEMAVREDSATRLAASPPG